MESRLIKIPKKYIGKYPYFAKSVLDDSIWLVTSKSRRGYVTATRISRCSYWAPFEYNTVSLRQSSLEKIDRMKLTLQIGDNVDCDA